jgi:hypothetical protein
MVAPWKAGGHRTSRQPEETTAAARKGGRVEDYARRERAAAVAGHQKFIREDTRRT